MSRIIEVEHAVKVYVEVDVEEGRIVRVVEHNDDIEPTGRFSTPDEDYITAEEIVTAVKIAEDHEWPAWERGY